MNWTIRLIKEANKNAGKHFFEKETMRFFSSRILPTVYQGEGGMYFVTSEVDPSGKKAYTVREFIPDTKEINTVGEFHRLTRDQAKQIARIKSSLGEKACSYCGYLTYHFPLYRGIRCVDALKEA